MVRKKGGEAAPQDDGRKSFELDEHQAESLRSAVETPTTDGQADPVEVFWARMGEELGFDPETLILPEVPDDGPVSFTAIPSLVSAVAQLGDAVDEHEALEEREEPLMPAIARLEAIASETIPEGRALVRFAAGFMLDQIKHAPRWDDLLEAQQRDLGATVQQNAVDLVGKIVEAVRANGAEAIPALLESYSEKDGIKAVLKIKPEDDEQSLAAIIGLHRAQGKRVLIMVASAQDFDHDPGEIEIMPDEPGLGFDAGSDEHPGDDRDLAGEGEKAEAEAEEQA
jgi:hypothetical protein